MNRKTSGACIAAMLSFGAVAFAQTTGQSQPQTRTAGTDQQSQASQVTVVGCIQREADYRQAHEQGRGGAMGTGMGAGNEFVLINASMGESTSSGGMGSGATGAAATGTGATASGTAASGTTGTGATGTAAGTTSGTASGTTGTGSATMSGASAAGSGMAYRLTGDRESELEKHVGQRVEIVGRIRGDSRGAMSGGTSGAGTGAPASGAGTTGTGTSGTGTSGTGTPGATAGGSFSDLREIDITSFRVVPGSCPAK